MVGPKTTRPSAVDFRRRSSTLHYQTFPNVKPPTSRGRPFSSRPPSTRIDTDDPSSSTSNSDNTMAGRSGNGHHHETPLPVRQLAVLAFIALAEQTAFNSISPYLPAMTASFPEVKDRQAGLYVGLIASAFALAQFTTNFFWGWLSDRIGRKPVILCGTLLTSACFAAFGFSRRLWQAILIQTLLGLFNGNQALVSTCLGEITDRSNQSKAFTYLPIIYGLGAITGPAIGGLLVLDKHPFKKGEPNPYPYLLPNLISALILFIDAILIMVFLEESLDGAKELPPLGERVENFFTWLWQFVSSSHRPTYMRHRHSHYRQLSSDTQASNGGSPSLLPNVSEMNLPRASVFNRDTILLLITFLIFQLSIVAYNALYPIFGQEPEPTGRDMSPEEIGLSIAVAGIFTIVFQIFFYGRIRDKIGNRVSFRLSHFLFVLAFLIMPFVGYLGGDGIGNGRYWVWTELGISLIFKTVATVGGLTSALLMITNSAPDPAVLGRLNGLAQTLSAAGHAIGPFVAGSIFTAAAGIEKNGEALVFGLFAGIAFLGFLLSFGIRSEELEAEDWDNKEEDEDEEAADETTPILSRQSR